MPSEMTYEKQVYIVAYSKYASKRSTEWEKIKSKDLTADNYNRILVACPDVSIRNIAARRLYCKSQEVFFLQNILRYCTEDKLKNKAAHKLITSNNQPILFLILKHCTNSNLLYQAWKSFRKSESTELTSVICNCKNTSIVKAASKMLRKRLRLSGILTGAERINERVIIQRIAETVVKNPSILDMQHWHCLTSHCLAGWACEINKTAKKIEKDLFYVTGNTAIAGATVIPSYARLFYATNDTVLAELKKIHRSTSKRRLAK